MDQRLPDYIEEDLLKSGLTPDDLNCRPLENTERAVTVTPVSVQGYVLPYWDIHGKMLPHYRVRLFEDSVKYRQPKDSANHVYFPKNFWDTLGNKKYVVVTVGEKRAALGCKAGFPCVAFAGVEGWRNKIITVSGDAALAQANNRLAIRVSVGDEISDYNNPIAVGFTELVDLVKEKGLYVIIVYDSEQTTGKCTSDTQRAAADLGYELRFRGIDFFHIRQVTLPKVEELKGLDRIGLDDFLVFKGLDAFRTLLTGCLGARGAFPQHPNIRDYINKRLQTPKMNRKDRQNISLAVLSDLDSHGIRLRSPSGETFYFDHVTRRLMKAAWPTAKNEQFDSAFTHYLYREYGLSAADYNLIVWLGTQFAAEDPVEEVQPFKIFARPDVFEDQILLQISDSEFAKLTATGLEVRNNGDFNILFEADQVEPLNKQKLVDEFKRQAELPRAMCWWATTLSEVRLRDKDKQRIVAALLYYMSPWLFRWRGMQLPVELIIGESGSGKSTLCELRLDILTGRPLLRNTPTDLKDWHASVTNSGGLHVTDNVQLVDKTMRQRLSDEMCRIVTEPEPFIEQRKYFTNADVLRIPVRAVFALTAIQQPFQNADLLQRAIILELDKSLDQNEVGLIRYDSNWKAKQLSRFGGREAWVAHHLVVLQKFFQLVGQKWDNNYQAKHRLINFEQSVLLMAEVFGIPGNWIPDFLVNATDRAVSEADWILEGLHAFALEHNVPGLRGKRFRVSVISEWVEGQQDYKDCEMLVNTRKLGRYLKAHKSAIFHLTGMNEAGMEGNRICYRFEGKTLERR